MNYKFENGNIINEKGKPVPVWKGKVNIKDGDVYHCSTFNKFCLTNFKEQYIEWKIKQLEKQYGYKFENSNIDKYLKSNSEDPTKYIFSLSSNKFLPPVYFKGGIRYQVSINSSKQYIEQKKF